MLTARSLVDCRILICDDAPDIQRLVATVLTAAGAEVSVAENGQVGVEEALSAVSLGRPFDVLLMDIQMPVLDGLEAARHLRLQGYDGPIVAFTALASPGSRKKCLAAGFDDHLSKPVECKKLISVATHFAERSRRAKQATTCCTP